MAKSGGRMRIIEYSGVAVDLSRADTGLIRMRVGSPERDEPSSHVDLHPADARVLAHSLLAAALRELPEAAGKNGSDWPEEYWARGSFPGDLRQNRPSN
jgi:hypothetical protein